MHVIWKIYNKSQIRGKLRSCKFLLLIWVTLAFFFLKIPSMNDRKSCKTRWCVMQRVTLEGTAFSNCLLETVNNGGVLVFAQAGVGCKLHGCWIAVNLKETECVWFARKPERYGNLPCRKGFDAGKTWHAIIRRAIQEWFLRRKRREREGKRKRREKWRRKRRETGKVNGRDANVLILLLKPKPTSHFSFQNLTMGRVSLIVEVKDEQPIMHELFFFA